MLHNVYFFLYLCTMNDSISTHTYGLIGYPLGHSFSKGYFTDFFSREGINAEYKNFELPQIDDLRQKLGLAVLFIAHDLSVVKYFCDRVAVMHQGRILELAPAGKLFAHPIHPYTKSLLSAIPIPDPERERQRRRIFYEPLPPAERQMRQILPGHFVFCSIEEEKAWKK